MDATQPGVSPTPPARDVMDDLAILQGNESPVGERSYLCPGESHPIDAAIHRARLAAHYPACRQCLHRHELDGLTSVQRSGRAEYERHVRTDWQWTPEGLDGTCRGAFDAEPPARLVVALAGLCWERTPAQRPTLLVASDGGWSTAGLVPHVCRALQLTGVLAIDVGECTTGSLASAMASQSASGAVWLGNASGEPHALAARVFLADGQPLSAPGRLDLLRGRCQSALPRVRRSGGEIRRASLSVRYLEPFLGAFHGLRPFTVVVDTVCEMFVRAWEQLSTASDCQLLRRHELPALAGPLPSDRRQTLGRHVVGQGAHMGIWVCGQAERVQFVDERGEAADSAAVYALLAGEQLSASRGTLACWGQADLSREESWQAIRQAQVAIAGVGDRYWFSERAVAPDALAAVCLLLRQLSQSDRTLSEALDAARRAG